MIKPLLLLVTLGIAAGCASQGTGGKAVARTDPNVIRRSEVSDAQLLDYNVYQVVQQLRPRFLANLGPTAIGPDGGGLLVYLEATRLGNVNTMRDIRMVEIEEIRYLSPSEATLRYGTGHANGVILLTRTRR